MNVTDSVLTGYIWSANLGWISLSCQNTASCGTVDYGVQNDGAGHLSGFAWSPNVGWINFRPLAAGPLQSAQINPATGVFTGFAYGANIGWIEFGPLSGQTQYTVETSWRGRPTPTPGGPTLTPTPTITPGGPTLTPTPTITPGGPTLTPTPAPVPLWPRSRTSSGLWVFAVSALICLTRYQQIRRQR
jgi:hypothetical protein